MPLYEYKCDNCGNLFEAVQKFADPYLTVHEECGGGPVHRLLSVPSLQFKGTGFYITDYAKGSGAGPASNGPGKKSESASGSESKSDSGSSSNAPANSTTSSESKPSGSESKSSSNESKSSSDKK